MISNPQSAEEKYVPGIQLALPTGKELIHDTSRRCRVVAMGSILSSCNIDSQIETTHLIHQVGC
jgi:hypothetical protein